MNVFLVNFYQRRFKKGIQSWYIYITYIYIYICVCVWIEKDILSKRIYEKKCVFNDDYPIDIYRFLRIENFCKNRERFVRIEISLFHKCLVVELYFLTFKDKKAY